MNNLLGITENEKRKIRTWYYYWKLRFQSDGTVLAQKQPGGAWGMLYHPRDTINHLAMLREEK